MLDVFEVADVLVSHAVRTYGNRIDLIGYYGSHAQGVATAHSDLDIFFIPAEGKDSPKGRTFLIDGTPFDFWSISWATMEGFATGRIRGWADAPGIVYHTKVLHARSEEPISRLARLTQQIVDLQKSEAQSQMIRRALDTFPQVLAHLGNLRLAVVGGDFTDVRHAGWKVIMSVRECLALANQMFFDRRGSTFLGQLSRLKSRPADLEQLIITISTSPDPAQIASAADRLAMATRQILRHFQESLPSQKTVDEQFRQAYPEIRGGIGKVFSACERQDPVAASAAAWFWQSDLALMLMDLRNGAIHPDFNLYSEFAALFREIGLPDLMRFTSGDLTALAEQTRRFDEQIRSWLQSQSVSLESYATLEEFERSLGDK